MTNAPKKIQRNRDNKARTIRVPADVDEQVSMIAGAEYRTWTGMALVLIREALDARRGVK